jgi:MFS family permease
LAKKIYYGWWIVLAAFVTNFICAGIGFFTLPVFLKFVSEDMGWGLKTLSVAGAISALAGGFISPGLGYIIDRFGPRAVMIPGALILASSLFLLRWVGSTWQLYLLFLALGMGMAGTTILPSQTLISRWFAVKRGRAMGIIAVSGGLGGVIWMPVANHLIASIGWRDTYAILGIIVAAATIPIIAIIIRPSPASMGLPMDGLDVSPGKEAGGAEKGGEPGYSTGEAVKTKSFLLILCSIFFLTFASSGFGLHAINFFVESGLPSDRATYVWSATFAVSIVGRFFFGYISERFQKRYMASTANVVRAASVVLLVLFSFKMLPAPVAIVQLVILYGLGNACNAVMNPLIIGETFGVKAFGKVMGLIGIPYTIGMALGQVAGGLLYDWKQDYTIAFGAFALSFILAGVAISFARPLFLLESREALGKAE